jgi:SPP1 gp7 family putative phage head morphogenesis protein
MPAPNKRPTTLTPTRPNEGIRVDYQRRLERQVSEMAASVTYWLTAEYRANPPEAMAADASPARALQAAIRKLGRRWIRKFDRLAPELAAYFATAATDRSDKALAASLRKAGFTVRFKPTAAQNDAYQATIAENVALIKSIPREYMLGVEGEVMRSVQAGRDLGTLAKALEERHGVTARRAALIARDQNNKATATMTRVRQRELGITKAIWVHSAGGKHPRPEHVAFSGSTYDIEKGAFLEGKWTWPGVEINCRCVSRSVVPGFDA